MRRAKGTLIIGLIAALLAGCSKVDLVKIDEAGVDSEQTEDELTESEDTESENNDVSISETFVYAGDLKSDTSEMKKAMSEDAASENADSESSDSESVSVNFSVASGIYEDEFLLELTNDEYMQIFYTTDGSNPLYSDTAMKYDKPIQIASRDDEPNVVSAVPPQVFCSSYSTYSAADGLRCKIEAPQNEDVDKCTVIRAAIKESDYVSEVTSATYFIGTVDEHIEGIKETCDASKNDATNGNLAVVSITMDYDDLFNPGYGIYVKGNIFDMAMSNELTSNKSFQAEDARKLPANYNQRGKSWEKIANMEFFEVNANGMQSVFNQDCGVRIQGNYSRSDLQKSFRLYARKDYGKKKFDYPVWGEEALDENQEIIESFDSMVLRAGGNCAFTAKYNDTYWQNLASGLHCDTKASRPCIVYLNGEYWGLYVLEEDYSNQYYESHYGVDHKQIVVYKGDAETYSLGYKLDEGKLPDGEGDDYYFRELNEFFATHSDLSKQEDYLAFAELVDVDSVMDYFATEVWINNKWDWPGKNWSMWRTIEVDENNPYADGKWRFSLYDVEFGGVSGKDDASTNTVKEDNYKPKGLLDMNTTNPAVLCFAYLMTNDEFNQAYCERLSELSATCFMKEKALSQLSYYENVYGPLYDQFFERYPDSGKKKDALSGGYASSKCIHDFLMNRAGYINEIIDYCK